MLNLKLCTGQSPRTWTRLWKSLFIVSFVSTMMGCAAQTQLSSDRPKLPGNLTSPCPPLTALEDGTKASVLRKIVEVGEQYNDCASKHQSLIDAVK